MSSDNKDPYPNPEYKEMVQRSLNHADSIEAMMDRIGIPPIEAVTALAVIICEKYAYGGTSLEKFEDFLSAMRKIFLIAHKNRMGPL